MSDDDKIKELHVQIDPNYTNNNNYNKDCLACKITGSVGMFCASVYCFVNARKQTKAFNRNFINVIASGNLVFFFFLLGVKFPRLGVSATSVFSYLCAFIIEFLLQETF